MSTEIELLISGILFGLTAGITPGPLSAVVISETIMQGKIAGIKVALVPLITDIPILAAIILMMSQISNFDSIAGLISIGGAIFLGYLGIETIMKNFAKIFQQRKFDRIYDTKTEKFNVDFNNEKSQTLRNGLMANLLNPHPYLFYVTIGAPTIIKAFGLGILPPLLFIGGFFFFLVGTKVVLALIVSRSKEFLKSKEYIYTIKILGIVLLIFAVMFLKNGLQLLGI
ncbi:LysE family transporter [Candidatus Micrarchaeota archaeon]|nr:LysE family transporter [Candidatus Micrarchaeota archaeon]